MQYKKPRDRSELEHAGVERLRALMHREGWYTKKTHGSMFSSNWPDLLTLHPIHGRRWIECKTKDGQLSDGQIAEFALWAKHDEPVWVLRDEKDYRWLFEPANWYKFALPKKLRPL